MKYKIHPSYTCLWFHNPFITVFLHTSVCQSTLNYFLVLVNVQVSFRFFTILNVITPFLFEILVEHDEPVQAEAQAVPVNVHPEGIISDSVYWPAGKVRLPLVPLPLVVAMLIVEAALPTKLKLKFALTDPAFLLITSVPASMELTA